MHTTVDDYQLIRQSRQSKRYMVTFLASVLLLFLLLLVPVKIIIESSKEQTIELILSKPPVVAEKKVSKVAKVEKPVSKGKKVIAAAKVKKKLVKQAIIKKPEIKIVKFKTPIKKPIITVKKQQPLPTTADLLNSIKTRKTVQLSSEFQVKTGHEDNYVYKSVEQAEMFKEFKLINEEIDKPQYEMNFYAEGIEGSVERFMDKITYKKRFTTKYGTKIDCAAVALVIVACGWK